MTVNYKGSKELYKGWSEKREEAVEWSASLITPCSSNADMKSLLVYVRERETVTPMMGILSLCGLKRAISLFS